MFCDECGEDDRSGGTTCSVCGGNMVQGDAPPAPQLSAVESVYARHAPTVTPKPTGSTDYAVWIFVIAVSALVWWWINSTGGFSSEPAAPAYAQAQAQAAPPPSPEEILKDKRTESAIARFSSEYPGGNLNWMTWEGNADWMSFQFSQKNVFGARVQYDAVFVFATDSAEIINFRVDPLYVRDD